MKTASEIVNVLTEAILINIESHELLVGDLTEVEMNMIAIAMLTLAKKRYPTLIPENAALVVELCGNSCNCKSIVLGAILSALIAPPTESIYVESENKNLH